MINYFLISILTIYRIIRIIFFFNTPRFTINRYIKIKIFSNLSARRKLNLKYLRICCETAGTE